MRARECLLKPASGFFKRLAHGVLVVSSLGITAPAAAAIRPLTGDWNGDSSTNVAMWNDAIRRVLFDANEDGRIDGISPALGLAGDVPVAGDWDGDGTDTVALYRPATGRLYVYISNTRVVTPVQTAILGAAGDIPLRGDWDGDGRDGLALYRPSTRVFTFYQTVSSTTAFASCDAGNPGDLPLTGDWDGDGADGFAVYRPQSRDFWFYPTPCGAVNSHLASIGNPGDVPIAGRWSGQSSWSVSLYRPSSSRFWMYRPGEGDPFSSFAWESSNAVDQSAGRQLFYTAGTPHTDRQGAIRNTYDSASFFPRGIYGITQDVFGTLAAAGFNTAMIYPFYDLDTALADAAPHGVQAVAYFSHAGGRPLVGRFAGGATERFATWASNGRNVWIDVDGDSNADQLAQVDPGDVPFVGDWDGDGVDGFMLYRPSTRELRFYHSMNDTAGAFTTFDAGDYGDLPIAGDWDGDGADGYALYRPSTRDFWFYQHTDTTATGFLSSIGNPGDLPVAGDWNGDGSDTVGLFRASRWNQNQTFWLHNGSSFTASINLGNGLVRRFDGEAGLLAWHTCDEPTGGQHYDRCGLFPEEDPGINPNPNITFTEILSRLTDLYSVYTPLTSRPLFHVNTEKHDADNPNGNAATWNGFAALGDVVAADQYPVKPSAPPVDFVRLADTVSGLRTASGGTKPVWFVPQAFYYQDNVFPLVQPTVAQYRAMVYTAVVHGATGLFTFIWDGSLARQIGAIGIAPDPQPSYGPYLEATSDQIDAATALWGSIDAQQSGLNAELAELASNILSSTSTVPYTITTLQTTTTIESPIRALLKTGPTGLTLITVNLSDKEVDAIVQLGGSEPESVQLPFESSSLATPLGGIRDTWKAWEVHVYRWSVP